MGEQDIPYVLREGRVVLQVGTFDARIDFSRFSFSDRVKRLIRVHCRHYSLHVVTKIDVVTLRQL
jgi:hypothetical protein